MCKNKKLQKKMVELFEEKVSAIPVVFEQDDDNGDEKAMYPIPVREREPFKKVVQEAFPDLRYRNIDGLVTIDDFAVKVEAELKKREDFFNKALELIRTVSKHPEYDFDSVLFAETLPKHKTEKKRLSEQANYFVKCQKVYRALSAQMYSKVIFHPTAPTLEKTKNLRELIDVYYRKGRF